MTTQPQDALRAPKWAALIYKKRQELGESQARFAERFGVSQASVSQWEAGITEAPYEVTWWVHTQEGCE